MPIHLLGSAGIHADLQPERLIVVANLVSEVWEGAREAQDEDAGDGPWGLGCRFYERMCYSLRKLSVTESWLRLVERGMHFVFAVGAVPVRFYRGRSRRVKPGYLVRREAEDKQQRLAFAAASDLDWVCRIAIEADYNHELARVVLVKQTIRTGESEEIWDIPFPRPGSVAAHVPDLRKPAVPIERPRVSPKRPAKKRRADDSEGS